MNDDYEEVITSKRNTARTVIALFTAIVLFIGSLQGYFYFIHPEPVKIPPLSQVRALLWNEDHIAFTSHVSENILEIADKSREEIKKVANFIASESCRQSDRVCQSKAIFYFVRDNIQYVSDENFHDQLENPLITLKTGGADCEDMAVLLSTLQKAIGNEARLVFVPGHAYAQVKIKNYRSEKWINLEATCDNCQFGEIPDETAIQKKEYLEI